MASALGRMALYQSEYGLTELRFHSTAFMLWLAVLLGVFVVTVLRDRREAFSRAAVGTAAIGIVLLHVVNPDERIVLANSCAVRPFDAAYAAGLSADAVPVLLDVVDELGEPERRLLAKHMLTRWESAGEPDLRAWSFARARARQHVEERASRLRGMMQLTEGSAR